jgi:hypothetical protein
MSTCSNPYTSFRANSRLGLILSLKRQKIVVHTCGTLVPSVTVVHTYSQAPEKDAHEGLTISDGILLLQNLSRSFEAAECY